jgi:predicted peptidase
LAFRNAVMRPALPISLFFIMLIILCCDHQDEVVPKPPVADPAPVTQPKDPEETVTPPPETPAPVDSAFYDYATFRDLPYRILIPRGYDSTKNYPVLLFLHGIGESGTDNERQLTWGASLFQADSIREKYPSFVIFPQCPLSHYWFDPWGIQTLTNLIDTLVVQYRIDKDRIYIGGLSMGAYGTYAMVAENPDVFAAAIAISGDGNPNQASKMAKTKWRIFAGKKDIVVASSKSEKMAKALEKSGASVSFTLYPDADHEGSWVRAFSEPDFCSWLFSISKQKDH